jgi:2-keto-4-pentenoate hydratase/2-oxohepta-3-ene-1,7-dioic acid hydratase in catechol pathway
MEHDHNRTLNFIGFIIILLCKQKIFLKKVVIMGERNISNIYCVGRNYVSFAKQMKNELPEVPIIFLKPTHSLKEMNDSTLYLHGNKGEVNGEVEVVIHIGKPYKEGIAVEELVDNMTIGIDLTYRDLLNEAKKRGKPWIPAKGFPNSATIGKWLHYSKEFSEENDFKLLINGKTQQIGNIKNMIFSLQTLIDFIGQNYGLGKGDIIYTGTPEGIGTLADGDVVEVQWGNENLGVCKIDYK